MNELIITKEHICALYQFLQKYISHSLKLNLEYINQRIVVSYEYGLS